VGPPRRSSQCATLTICNVQPTQAEWVTFEVYYVAANLAGAYLDPTEYIPQRPKTPVGYMWMG
jgi:hypothetical protein